MLVPTTCFNCESACGLLAYVDKETGQVRKFEGNPEHPGSRGRNCAKGPATINQITDPDRILYPLRRSGARGEGEMGTHQLGGGPRRPGRADPDRPAGRPPQRDHGAHRPTRRGRLHRAGPRQLGGGRPQQPYQRAAPVAGGPASSSGVGWTGRAPTMPTRKVIFLISAHLEAGHYFNPHAQRIIEARARGAKVIVVDTRLSNTATHADYWLSPQPGSEAAINLAIANHLIRTGRYDAGFVRRWWNWAEYLQACRPDLPVTFEAFQQALAQLYAELHLRVRRRRVGHRRRPVLEEVAEVVAGAGDRFACHTWRSAAAGNLGGWQVARTLFLLAALLGAVATEGGTFPNAWNKFVPRPSMRHLTRRCGRSSPGRWNTRWPRTRCPTSCPTS